MNRMILLKNDLNVLNEVSKYISNYILICRAIYKNLAVYSSGWVHQLESNYQDWFTGTLEIIQNIEKSS